VHIAQDHGPDHGERLATALVVVRPRILLLAADGLANTEIAARVSVSRPTVFGWRARHDSEGLDGLHDEPRTGRPRQVRHEAIIAATLSPPPKKPGCDALVEPAATWRR